MLILGTPNNIPYEWSDNLLVYNLTGLREGFYQLRILPVINPDNYLLNEKDFDMFLANYIFSNDHIFFEFFDKIIYPLYSGKDVYLIVNDSNLEYYNMINSSLLKLIQQRYTINGIIINTIEDLYYCNRDLNVTVQGVYNIDEDKARYTALYIMYNNVEFKTNEDGEVIAMVCGKDGRYNAIQL